MSVFSYFRHPFPSAQGFSAYRMPGMAVHGPLILASSLAGFLLCWPHEVLRPLLILWVLAGLYLGRDITILCHYNPLLTLLSWAVSGFVLFKPRLIADFGRSHLALPAVLSGVVGVVLLVVAYAMTRGTDRAG